MKHSQATAQTTLSMRTEYLHVLEHYSLVHHGGLARAIHGYRYLEMCPHAAGLRELETMNNCL